ncbi:MAG: histidine kinase [Gracilibacter sp. BRH_c7a]|nr:MAG: histidine kinase [Gracilibacter sp. BRH_c7a]
MKLSTKLIIATIILIIVMGLLTIGAITTIVEQAMTEQLEEQSLTFAFMAADNVANPLLDGNILIVQRMLENLQDTGYGISYAYIIDDHGKIIAHTFDRGFPINLTNINILEETMGTQTVLLDTKELGLIRDVGVRVIEGLNAEIHVGFSQNSILQFVSSIRTLLMNLTLYGILLGSAAALILSNLITKPLKMLANHALRLGRGDFEQDIVIKGNDEIAELGLCLNRMRQDISDGMTRLRQSEESNRTLLEAISSAGEGIVVYHYKEDNKHQIRYVNEQYEQLTGYSKEELFDIDVNHMVCSDSKEQLQEVWQRYQEGSSLPKQLEIGLKRKDGSKIYVEASYCRIIYEESHAIICINRDITEKKKSSLKLLQRNRELAALNELSKSISGSMNLKHTLEAALATILQVIGKQIGWIFVYREEDGGRKVKLMCQMGLPHDEALEQTVQFQECRCIPLSKVKEVQVHNPLCRECPINSLNHEYGISALSHVYVPLIYKGKVLGVLNIIGTDTEKFILEDIQILNSIGMQLGVAIENAKLWEELNKKEEIRKQLLIKVISAQEEERKRISRELHDETSQSVAALGVGLKSALEVMNQDRDYAQKILEDLKNNTSMTLKEVHRIIYDLRPSLLDDLGLLPALTWYAESRLANTRIKSHINIKGKPVRLSDETEITIFRIVQESIVNAVKYSNAKNLYLCFKFNENELIISVKDDGIGFDVIKTIKEGKESFGLLGMKERAELISGNLEIDSKRNEGTTIQLKLSISVYESHQEEGKVDEDKNPTG